MNCLFSLQPAAAQPSFTLREREPGEEKRLSANALINSHGEITTRHYPKSLVLLIAGGISI